MFDAKLMRKDLRPERWTDLVHDTAVEAGVRELDVRVVMAKPSYTIARVRPTPADAQRE